MDSQNKIEAILVWAENKPRFDTEFVEDLERKLSQYGELTSGQDAALDRIIESYRIPY